MLVFCNVMSDNNFRAGAQLRGNLLRDKTNTNKKRAPGGRATAAK